MTGESGAVHQHGVVADDRIVPHMRVRHDERVTPDASYTASLNRAPVQRDKLAHHIVIADFDPGLFASVEMS
jgi:hypothetical protein